MFFPLTRSVINQYFPLNNSFEEDFFARFEGAAMGTPFTYLSISRRYARIPNLRRMD